MLPASLQLPAAVVLIVSGLLACFAGYRLFRLVLSVYGFILGAGIASSVMGPGEQGGMIVAALVGGVVGAVVLNLAYFVGVALIGAAAGAFLLHAAWARFGTGDPHVALVIACAIVGAVLATGLQRWVIILATASAGAWTIIVGGAAVMGDRAAKTAAATYDVWVFYPFGLEPGRRWLIVAWLALAIAGIVVQAKGKGRPPAVKRARRRKD